MQDRQSRGNILYVDDEEGNLLAFVASFRKFYDKIYTVTSAKEGLEILHSHPIDVVLTDQRMPDMTGIEFLEKIIPDFPDTIRMIVTGFSDIDAVIHAINTGKVFRYIQKPWDKNELKLSIDQAIKTRALELSNRKLVTDLQNEVAQKEQILKIFKSYVPQNVVDEVTQKESDSSTSHSAELRVVSILFSTIHGFKFSEQSVAETTQFLNDYFATMVQCIVKHQGTLNHIGNGILAVFGAPTTYLNNTSNAVYCALEMVSLLDKIKATKGYNIEVGIGINTGEVIVGSLGLPNHIEYTPIGDAVSCASEIEDLVHDVPNGVLITESTYQEVKDNFECEALGPKILQGREEPVNIYRVIKPLIPSNNGGK
jgi:adenylate cyclase